MLPFPQRQLCDLQFVSQISTFDEAGLATEAQCIMQRLQQPEAFILQYLSILSHNRGQDWHCMCPIDFKWWVSVFVFDVKHSVTCSTKVCCGLACAGYCAFVCS